MLFKASIIARFPALSSRDFAIFWVGQCVSLIGTWMQSTTQPDLAYRISGQPFDLGVIGFAATLPNLFPALPGGVLVERFDKRKTVIILQAVMLFQALMLATLTLSGLIQIWHIVALAFILGLPTPSKLPPARPCWARWLVKNTCPLQATIFNAVRVLGPMIAAPLLVFVGSIHARHPEIRQRVA